MNSGCQSNQGNCRQVVGYLLVEQKAGTERSLGKLASGEYVMYVYRENGTKRHDCSLLLEPLKPADR